MKRLLPTEVLEMASSERPQLGHGVGLRVPHYERALDEGLDVDFVECISENFFGLGGRPKAVLRRLRERLPIVFHGVSMGIGSPEGPTEAYLARLRELVSEYDAPWFSDHLCWTHFGGAHSHDLLPLPYTEETLSVVARNVERAQECVGRRFLVENVSSYVGFAQSAMTEWEFLSALVQRTGCGLLLDVNNVVVNARNHGFDARDFVRGIPAQSVWQLHLANHADRGHYKFDSHEGAVPEEVWQLYEFTTRVLGQVSSIVEWDESVPPWEALRDQAKEAARRARGVLADAAPSKQDARGV